MPAFYRCPTPTDWLCPCGRVARELRRREIDVEVIRVPYRRSRRPEVVALSGQPHVPLLMIDGEAICDSRRIVEHLRWRARRSGESGVSSEPGQSGASGASGGSGRSGESSGFGESGGFESGALA